MTREQRVACREAFERTTGRTMILYRGGDNYLDPKTTHAWVVFQTAWAEALKEYGQ
jgi:hypothetical protein